VGFGKSKVVRREVSSSPTSRNAKSRYDLGRQITEDRGPLIWSRFQKIRSREKGGEYSSNSAKCEVLIRSRPLDHRGMWVIDLTQSAELGIES
jgi:hypothetical protein